MSELEEQVKRIAEAQKAKKKAVAAKKMLSLPNTNTDENVSETRDHSLNSVVKSNELSQAYYKVRLNEKRLMELLISRIHPQRNDNDFQDIVITSKMFCDVFGIDRRNGYKSLLDAAHGLQNTMVWIKTGDGTGERFGIVGKVDNDNINGVVTCSIAPWAVPHLHSFQGQFTSYALKHGADFRSVSTWRLYELMLSWSYVKKPIRGKKKISVDDLRKLLETPDSYPLSMFKRRVLEGARADLKELLNINLNIEYIKTSRKVTGLVLTYCEDEQQQIKFKEDKPA